VAIRRIMMATVQVRDFDVMVAWYRDVLGLEVLVVEPGEFCMLGASQGSTTIGLATDHPDRIPEQPGVGWTPILAVDEFDSFVAELRDRGVTFDAEEEGADEGYRLVRVRDPEGNAVGITAG
jgi:catechol 2,3-dioxygenase-like lactoylglutathione lyase family enzyme